MYHSERLIFAIGELSDEKIESAGAALGYRKPQKAASSVRLSRMLAAAAVLVLMLGVGLTAYPLALHRLQQQGQIQTAEEKLPVQASGEETNTVTSSLPAPAAQKVTAATAETMDAGEERTLYDGAAAAVFQPDAYIGNTGMKLLSAELTPDAARVTLKLPELRESSDSSEPFALRLVGVRLQDGTELPKLFTSAIREDYADAGRLILELEYSSLQAYSPQQIDALIFAEGDSSREEGSSSVLIFVPVS